MSNRSLQRWIVFLLGFNVLLATAWAQKDFNRFTYDAGIGVGIGKHDVASFVGNSFEGTAGFGMNLNRLFGVDAEYMFNDLNFRPSVKKEPGLADQSGHMQSISLDGIVNVPRHIGKVSLYGIFGVGFYDRTVSVPRQFLGPSTFYQPAYLWWDPTFDIFGNLLPQYISTKSKVAGGFNYGGGINYRLNQLHNAKLFVEWRYHRAYQSDGQTIVMPVTVGLRW